MNDWKGEGCGVASKTVGQGDDPFKQWHVAKCRGQYQTLPHVPATQYCKLHSLLNQGTAYLLFHQVNLLSRKLMQAEFMHWTQLEWR